MAWDDGAESNAYVVTNDNQRSRFSFVGKAAIDASGRRVTPSTSASGPPTPSWSIRSPTAGFTRPLVDEL